jgi:hypothetical protein
MQKKKAAFARNSAFYNFLLLLLASEQQKQLLLFSAPPPLTVHYNEVGARRSRSTLPQCSVPRSALLIGNQEGEPKEPRSSGALISYNSKKK